MRGLISEHGEQLTTNYGLNHFLWKKKSHGKSCKCEVEGISVLCTFIPTPILSAIPHMFLFRLLFLIASRSAAGVWVQCDHGNVAGGDETSIHAGHAWLCVYLTTVQVNLGARSPALCVSAKPHKLCTLWSDCQLWNLRRPEEKPPPKKPRRRPLQLWRKEKKT